MLKDTIFQLYSKEGRSKAYISKLLSVDRRVLAYKIKEWEIPEAPPHKYIKPSIQKFINRNRQFIKSRLDKNVSISEIARELNVSRDFIQKTIIPNDLILDTARNDYVKRIHDEHIIHIEEMKAKSNRIYDFEEYLGELWKDIEGYKGYQVSNMGRVRKEAAKYKGYYLIKPEPNKNNGRLYVMLQGAKRKNIQLARLVALYFVDGRTEEKNTVNHKWGNINDNRAEALEWTTQSENNKHSYQVLGRKKVNFKKSLKRILSTDQKHAVLLIEVENLNNYKSVYSEVAASKLIQTFVAITKSTLEADDFLGQLNDKTFIIITSIIFHFYFC